MGTGRAKSVKRGKKEAIAAVEVGWGKMREWDCLNAADSGGGMAESGRREGRECESCGRRAWNILT